MLYLHNVNCKKKEYIMKEYRLIVNYRFDGSQIVWIQKKGLLWGWNYLNDLSAQGVSFRRKFGTIEAAERYIVGLVAREIHCVETIDISTSELRDRVAKLRYSRVAKKSQITSTPYDGEANVRIRDGLKRV